MPWDPERYHQFQQERSAPFDDLVQLIKPRPGMRVVDLGCGTGELTRRLADMLPESEVVGVDSSAEMLEHAEQYEGMGLRFEQGKIEQVQGPWDLVFSHAAIHWIEHHEALIPRLLAMLAPGGQLAVQLPHNFTRPSHHLILEVAAEEPFAAALGGWTHDSPVLDIARYADLLYAHGGRNLTVFEKVYPHVLADAGALADWTSGTTLVPYFERLPEALHEPFMQRYRAGLEERYPEQPVFYGFRRILFAATREA